MRGIPPILWLLMRRSGRRRSYPALRAAGVRRSDGHHFEATCADTLRMAGWMVSEIGGKGDQGADLIARRMGVSVAVQCKDYSFPVPNAAVQEVYAAMAHYRTDRAVVATTGSYTQSALALARSTRVLTLDLEGLERLHETLGLVVERRRPDPVLHHYEFRPGGASGAGVLLTPALKLTLLQRLFPLA